MATLTKQQRANLENERAMLQRQLNDFNTSMQDLKGSSNIGWLIGPNRSTENTILSNTNRITNRIQEINQLLNSPAPRPTPRRTTNTNLTGPVVDSDGYTSATERNMRTKGAEFGGVQQTLSTFTPEETQRMLDSGMSVEQIQMYDDDNRGRYENQRNQTVGNNGTTRGQIFDQAVEKFLADPNSFTDDQKQALIKVGQQLGYFRDTPAAANTASATAGVTPTATTVQPTVQPTVTTAPTAQRRINNANDAYYSNQGRPYFGLTL